MLLQALTVALGLLPAVHASVEFSNNGTRSGWDTTSLEADGTIDQVSNVFLSPSSALKMTQTYLPNYSGRYHAEVVYNNGYKRGDTKAYGFAFRLSDKWDFEGSQSYNIAQWIADFGDTGCDDWSPTSMVYLRGNTLFSRVKTGQLLPGKECSQKTREFELQKGIEAGVWYKTVIQASWKSDNTGFFNAWINGTQVHAESNIATTLLDDKREFSFRIGLYANGWHDEHKLVGSGSRSVWIDEVAVGDAKEDVEPME